MKKTIILLGLLALAACSSAPTRFYQLTTEAPDTAPLYANLPPQPITVSAVTIPRLLDRSQIVRLTGNEQVELGAQDHWAAPLDALIQQALINDLALRVPEGSMVPAGAATATPPWTVTVDIQRFDGNAAGQVNLEAFWTVTGADPAKPLASHQDYIETAGRDGSYAGLANGMSKAVGMLATHIAAHLPWSIENL